MAKQASKRAAAGTGDLVVVESPSKARTLERMLGPGYVVEASYGHIRDLPKSKLGIDLETFAPDYIVPDDSEKVARLLRKEAKAAAHIWLATDLDREGEAIAWHVADVMAAPKAKLRRVTFHEITPAAIAEAFRKPRDIDMDLVNAQQARRVVDRLVGYKLSPLLWKKIRYGLSAGRVQSVALRLIVDREREIQAFTPEEYWSLDALVQSAHAEVFPAEVATHKGHKLHIRDQADADRHRAALADAVYRVAKIERREASRNAAAPFTTSTLQQEASRKLGFSLRRTMVVAQQLYEAGIITYMRTDSLHLAEGALHQAREVLTREFGAQYALERPRHYRTRTKGAQEAHEAIRPTDLSRTPQALRRDLRGDQLRLYTLVWQRTLASQMPAARYEQTRVDIEADGYVLRSNGRRLLFDGYLRAYQEGRARPRAMEQAEPEPEIAVLPDLHEGEELKLLGLDATQHFTQPPPRFTEASLVKALEEHGIGRPSTYAPTISTLMERKYVRREQRALVPEDVAYTVIDFLKEHFADIVDTGFTAHIEEDLDRIARGETEWVPVVREFYSPFIARVEEKSESVKRSDVVEEATDKTCPKCGRPVVIKLGRYGRFYSCTGFARGKKGQPLPPGACDYSAPLEGEKGPETLILEGEICPECGKPLARRRGRFGPFIGCTGYPECKYIKKQQVRSGVTCPQCGQGELVRRRGRRGAFFYGCERYPECTFTARELPAAPAEAAATPA